MAGATKIQSTLFDVENKNADEKGDRVAVYEGRSAQGRID